MDFELDEWNKLLAKSMNKSRSDEDYKEFYEERKKTNLDAKYLKLKGFSNIERVSTFSSY